MKEKQEQEIEYMQDTSKDYSNVPSKGREAKKNNFFYGILQFLVLTGHCLLVT